MAYLVGRKEFYSLSFAVSPAVLIPRPESEFVVVEYLEQSPAICRSPRPSMWEQARAAWRSLRRIASPEARFIAIDVSEEALAVARRNAVQIGVADRIDFRLGDQLEPVAGDGPFDAIISNPPYIPSDCDRTSRAGSPRS